MGQETVGGGRGEKGESLLCSMSLSFLMYSIPPSHYSTLIENIKFHYYYAAYNFHPHKLLLFNVSLQQWATKIERLQLCSLCCTSQK